LVYLAITAKGMAFYKDALIALIIKLFGFKIVYHFHNKGVKTRQNYFVDNLLYRLVFKNVEIILLSKFLFYDVQKYISPRHVHYCPNGIPYVSNNISKSNEKDKTQLLFVSNLIVSKGVFQLLEACQILKRRGLLFHCDFVGEIGDVSKNKFASKVKELGLNEFIKYLGPKYGIEKNNIYTDADIFVLPTHFETFGIVILEAMMHKLPVISTFEGAIPEIVKNGITGFLVHPNNVIELADKLEELIKNPMLRQKMGREGQNRFMKKFTIDNFENNLSMILKEIIKNNSLN
jgi:glycosyltransferase involved in cell wall biosynthesis